MPIGVYVRKPRPAKVKRQPIIPIGPSIAYVPLTQDKYALIDSDVADQIGQWNWHAFFTKDNNSFYAGRSYDINKKKICVQMHQVAIFVPLGMMADHINMNTLDNRRCNLRAATKSQNMRNSNVRKCNMLGLKGVKRTRHNTFEASIWLNNRKNYLGNFKTKEAAYARYCEAASEAFGEFFRP